jgi:Protein of unknown function (DUF2846)
MPFALRSFPNLLSRPYVPSARRRYPSKRSSSVPLRCAARCPGLRRIEGVLYIESEMTKSTWISLLAAAALFGCATTTVPMATPVSDAAAKRFMPPDGKANLYVARSNSSFGAAVSFNIVVDGKVVGQIAPGTFYLVVVKPGMHSVAATSSQNSAKADFDAEAGKNYFYEVTATSGAFGARADLGLVLLEPMGKIMVQQAKRAQSQDE